MWQNIFCLFTNIQITMEEQENNSKNQKSDNSKKSSELKKNIIKVIVSAGLFLFEMVKIAVIAGITIGLIRYFLFKPFYVKGASMEPNFYEREYLIIDELSYRFREPMRGEVVVFRFPDNPKEHFLKRIIGLPGETVKISSGQVIIYNADHPEGIVIDEFYLPDDIATEGDRLVTIEEDQFFLMGDNRPNSFDSRRFGSVDRSLIVGRAWIRGWPFSRAEIFSAPNLNI
jgi:signal peptidase I